MDFSSLLTLIAILIGAAAAKFFDPFFWFAALFLLIPPHWIWRLALACVLALGYGLSSWSASVSFAESIGYSPTPLSMILASSGVAFLFVFAAISLVRFLLKDRRDVFQSGNRKTDSQKSKDRPQKLPKDMRIALFAAVSWIVCAPLYVFLFKPYGRFMRGDDTLHLIGVIFIPAIVGLGLFFIYRRFIH